MAHGRSLSRLVQSAGAFEESEMFSYETGGTAVALLLITHTRTPASTITATSITTASVNCIFLLRRLRKA